jgi:cobalamin biosynthesis Mg chelatase CobN
VAGSCQSVEPTTEVPTDGGNPPRPDTITTESTTQPEPTTTENTQADTTTTTDTTTTKETKMADTSVKTDTSSPQQDTPSNTETTVGGETQNTIDKMAPPSGGCGCMSESNNLPFSTLFFLLAVALIFRRKQNA